MGLVDGQRSARLRAERRQPGQPAPIPDWYFLYVQWGSEKAASEAAGMMALGPEHPSGRP
jgi:hypothetical protein